MNDETTRLAEGAFIGSLLKSPKQLETVHDMLTRDDLQFDAFRWVWDAMLALRERNMGIDPITVGDELERSGLMADFGFAGRQGRNALAYIRDEGIPGNAATYAANVLDYSAKRKMVAGFSKWAEQALNGRHASELQKDIITGISDITVPNQVADTHTMTLGGAVSLAYDETILSAQGKRKVAPTGFLDLDRLLDGGLCAPDVYILAARPGQGKTALLLNIAYNAAKDYGKKVCFFSLEMANTQLAMRMIALESGITFGKQRQGKMDETEWPLYNHAIENLEALPVYLCDLPAIKMRQMSRVLRTLEARHGKMDVVMVDYLQLADAEGRYETRQLEVSRIMAGLKNMTKEFEVPIFSAAQLSRAVEMRADRHPILSDLRESGSIEADADVVAFIYRPDQYEADTVKKNIAEVIIAKHRNGQCGTFDLLFRPERTKFENCIKRHVDLNDLDTRRKDIYGD